MVTRQRPDMSPYRAVSIGCNTQRGVADTTSSACHRHFPENTSDALLLAPGETQQCVGNR